jgi:hypothetical protein
MLRTVRPNVDGYIFASNKNLWNLLICLVSLLCPFDVVSKRKNHFSGREKLRMHVLTIPPVKNMSSEDAANSLCL